MMDFLLICLASSLFCVGIYLGMGEGMILHPLKKWYDGIPDRIEILKNKIAVNESEPVQDYYRAEIAYWETVAFIFKPVCGCVTCMASVWGFPAYIILNHFFVGGNIWMGLFAIPVIAVLNTYIFKKVND